MTIKEYLEGFFEEGVFTDKNFKSIFAKWDVDGYSEVDDVGEREKDLCKAELYLILASKVNSSGSSSKSGESITRGNFSISNDNSSSERSYSMTHYDRDYLRKCALYLFRKWDVEVEEDTEFHYQIGVIEG